ncbi:hypothetical protein Ga0074812_14530 [Parafrankia irregularis]|uniref:Uncharacterized protein n=1 Tax=Parafrankia irregularis TaxID=795642 RepID=A0A0S4QZM4_9ACTN|nr:hypothetical protein Ga0074812_14530 [Parafrankia irregularis]
MERVRGGT